ncbi:MAG: NACHT domain-containing protein [Nostoc sp.]|uniref:NACHT domain-containing protein n=1 Tax=Nostoc sp. TaxID=1180 RepID=UPI002FF530F0
MDWLVVWGVSNAIGFLFQPVMQQFAQDLGKDLAKDVLKDVLKGIPTQFSQKFKKEEIQITAGKAVREFLELVQNDLQDSGLSEQQIKQYNQPLKKFLEHEIVKELLGSVFNSVLNHQSEVLDTKRLEKIWTELKLLPLPDDFNWKRLTNKYVIKVKEIVLASNAFGDIYNSYTWEIINESIERTAVINPGFDLYKYQEAIKEQYSNLKLESLDTSGYAYNKLKLWRMFIPQNLREVHQFLPQVHEIPKEHQRRLKESNQLEIEHSQAESESEKQAYYRQSPHWVFEIWNDKQNSQCVIILGDPGSGKSTLLQYIALEWAESPVKDLPLLPIPLLIELRTYIRNRDFGQCKDFLEFFHKGGGIICRLDQLKLHELLKAGNAVVMFDGLDEVFDPAKREDVITDIHRFTNDYSQVRVIVTSRVIGYKPQRFGNAGFRHFMLQDLEQYQIDDFIHRWHELTFNDQAEKIRKRDRLQAAINTSSAIRELAGNPLLLTMMAILNRNQELPRDRPELYNQASRVLLHQWDVERALVEDYRLDPKTIDYKDKQAMLRHVACHMQAIEKGLAANLIVANDLEKILTDYLKTIEVSQARTIGRLMKEQLRTRNFILCFLGADYYAFVHRTFL